MGNDISFTTMELLVNEAEPTVEFFKFLQQRIPTTYETEATYHFLNCEYIENVDSFWFYSCYGNPLPYNEQVYNASTEEFEANPREKDQVEPRQQLYALYSFRKKELFISNSKKKQLLQSIFSTYGGTENVVIRKIYADIDTFLDSLRSVTSVRMVAKRDLISQDNDIFKASSDMFGLDEPDQIKIDMHFGYVKPTKAFLRNFKAISRDGRSKKLVCVGTDEERLESVFNSGNIEDRITIFVQPNQDGMRDIEKVKSELLARLDQLCIKGIKSY